MIMSVSTFKSAVILYSIYKLFFLQETSKDFLLITIVFKLLYLWLVQRSFSVIFTERFHSSIKQATAKELKYLLKMVLNNVQNCLTYRQQLGDLTYVSLRKPNVNEPNSDNAHWLFYVTCLMVTSHREMCILLNKLFGKLDCHQIKNHSVNCFLA